MIDLVPFDAFYYSLDWHPQDHISFIDNVKLRKLDADSKVMLRYSKVKQARCESSIGVKLSFYVDFLDSGRRQS